AGDADRRGGRHDTDAARGGRHLFRRGRRGGVAGRSRGGSAAAATAGAAANFAATAIVVEDAAEAAQEARPAFFAITQPEADVAMCRAGVARIAGWLGARAARVARVVMEQTGEAIAQR